MKAIMESWREFLKVNVDVEGWGSIPPFSGKALQVLIDGQRLIVVVTTSQYGPTAFYQSTGTGSNITTKDMWLPMGGVASRVTLDGKGAAWIIKDPAGKVPNPGTELYMYGEWLAKSYAQRHFPTRNWKDWIASMGLPTYEEVERLTNNEVFRVEYGAMIANLFLKKQGALKVAWCGAYTKCAGFFGAQNPDTKIPGKKYSLNDLKRLKK
mgnify:FL=1|jgi:hypothetical protein|tara:strand:- start:256 stop:885 length:630 start_codon:yes stop_codon:yes gene_type:complete